MTLERVGPIDVVWPGEMVGTQVQGQSVLVVNQGGSLCAYLDRCPHLGMPLSEGAFGDGELTCRAHRWRFDAATGHGINPQGQALTRVVVAVREGWLYVDPAAHPAGGPAT